MTCDVQSAGTIELFFYGELSSIERAAVQSHLRQCAECRRVVEDLSVIRAALASRPDIATPPGGDWSAFMARIEDARAVQQRPDAGQMGSVLQPRQTIPWRTSFAPYLALAATLLLITIGVLVALRQGGRGDQPDLDPAIADRGRTGVAGSASVSAPEPRLAGAVDPALVTLTGQHFERSKLVVLGLATKDARAQDQDDWAYERVLASTLLGDTRLYRRAAEERGMTTLAGVMRDLELVLLQTSMSEQSDGDSLEQLQRLIRRRDLLTKMNAVYVGGP
jgi:Putative zinc-finger